jgi:hypothetical protein
MNLPGPDPTIFDIITEDHRAVARLLERLVVEPDLGRRERLFVEIRQALDLHTRAEETVIYDLLAEQEHCVPLIQRGWQEHESLRRTRGELDRMAVDDARWPAALDELIRGVVALVEREEDELFAAVRGVLDDDQARTVAGTFSAAKSMFAGELEVAA